MVIVINFNNIMRIFWHIKTLIAMNVNKMTRVFWHIKIVIVNIFNCDVQAQVVQFRHPSYRPKQLIQIL